MQTNWISVTHFLPLLGLSLRCVSSLTWGHCTWHEAALIGSWLNECAFLMPCYCGVSFCLGKVSMLTVSTARGFALCTLRFQASPRTQVIWMNLVANSSPPPQTYASLVKKGRKQAAVHGFKLVCGAERLSGDHDLGGNGEVFERSEGIFFSFFYMC